MHRRAVCVRAANDDTGAHGAKLYVAERGGEEGGRGDRLFGESLSAFIVAAPADRYILVFVLKAAGTGCYTLGEETGIWEIVPRVARC